MIDLRPHLPKQSYPAIPQMTTIFVQTLSIGNFPRYRTIMTKVYRDGKVFWGKTYDVSQYDKQRSHPSMNLGVKWDLCVLFVQTAVKCQDCKFV